MTKAAYKIFNYRYNLSDRKDEDDNWKGRFWNYQNISALDVKCMALQGLATTLIPFLLEDDSQ
jgi:hypothetical protein